MSWTYSGDPATSDLDWVRSRIGDTNQQSQLITNEIILETLATEPNTYAAAATCCELIAAMFAREVDRNMGKTSVRSSQKAEAYTKLASIYRKRAAKYQLPYAGGISSTEVSDSSVKPMAFSKGMMDYE